MLRECGSSDADFKCGVETEGNFSLHFCHCRDSLCNLDWISAGESEPTQTPPGGSSSTHYTEPHVPQIQCYKCDSKENSCTESNPGSKGDCPQSSGCTISQGDGVMLRDCGNSDSDFKCGTQTFENITTSYCHCRESLCNESWQKAGLSSAPVSVAQWGAVTISLLTLLLSM